MNAVWQVQEAKNHLSEVIDKALTEGPQTVTRHGKAVVTISAISSAAAKSGAKPETRTDGKAFVEFLLSMPKSGLPEGLPTMPRRNRRKPIQLGD